MDNTEITQTEHLDFVDEVAAREEQILNLIDELDRGALFPTGQQGKLGQPFQIDAKTGAVVAAKVRNVLLDRAEYHPALGKTILCTPWHNTERVFPGRTFFEATVPLGLSRLDGIVYPRAINLHVTLKPTGGGPVYCWRPLGNLEVDKLATIRAAARVGGLVDAALPEAELGVAKAAARASLEWCLETKLERTIDLKRFIFSGPREEQFTIWLADPDLPLELRSVLLSAPGDNENRDSREALKGLSCEIVADYEMIVRWWDVDVAKELPSYLLDRIREVFGLSPGRKFRRVAKCDFKP